MTLNITYLPVLLTLLSGTAVSAPIITLDPPSGTLNASPGQTAGWGFTIQADPSLWVSFVSCFLIQETNPSLGIYTDLIGLQGGPSNFVLAPGVPDWIQEFNELTGTGIGSYAFDSLAPIGSTNSGSILIAYQLFSADPNSCASCFVSDGEATLAFSALSSEAVPEPSTSAVMLLSVGLIFHRTIKRRSA